MKFLKDKPLDLRFNDVTRHAYQYHPVKLAKDTPSHFQDLQVKKYGKFKFPQCPGTMDLRNYGYIIPAWDNIEIIANKSGVMCVLGSMHSGRTSNFHTPKKMEKTIVDGVFQPEEVPLEVWHVGSPWSVEINNKDISCLVLAAPYHSPFLDNIYVYPGIVDYGNFTSLNFIFAAKRAGKFTIPAGCPLLQVIPFAPGNIKAGYGPAEDYQIDKAKSIFSTAKNFYKKYISYDKRSSIVLDKKDGVDG